MMLLRDSVFGYNRHRNLWTHTCSMMRMASNNPRLFVVDDDRAVLSLVGTTVTCLDVLRALRHVSPKCEPVVMTGYKDLGTAVDAVKQSLPAGSEPISAPASGGT